MATTRTVGTTGADHTDLNGAVSWFQANVVVAGLLTDNIEARVKAVGFSATAAQTVSGWAPSVTGFTTTLTANPGDAFTPNVISNPLFYNTGNGAFIALSSSGVVDIQVNKFRVNFLQIKNTGNYGAGLLCSTGTITDAIVEGNIIWATLMAGGTIKLSSAVDGIIIRNNLIMGDRQSAIDLNNGCQTTSAKIYDNVLWYNSSGGSANGISGGSYGKVDLKGNVFLGNGSANNVDCRSSNTTGSNNATAAASWTGSNFGANTSLATGQKLSITVANEFIDADATPTDFRLKTGGTALQGTGVTIAGITTDIAGQTRSAGFEDIGCWQKTTAAASAPFNNYDFYNPRAPRRADQTQPLGTELLILAGQDALPVQNYDFPNPRAARQAVQTQPLGTNSAYFPVAALVPFAQYAWPNPPAPRRADQTQPLGTELLILAGQDALPTRNYDFPNPRGARRPDLTQPLGVLTGLIPITVAAPFFVTAWPNPMRVRQPDQSQPLGTPDLLNLLAGQDALPFRLREFPNPRGAAQPVQTQPLGTNPSYIPGFVQPPFFQTDWPNPRVPRRADQTTQPLGTELLILAGQDALPTRNYDFPNPRGARQAVQTQPLGTLTGLIPITFGLPLSQYDWPNPRAARQAVQTQPLGTFTARIPIGPKPFALYEWPNPRCPIQPIQTQPLGLNIDLFPAPPSVVASPCNILSGAPRSRILTGAARVRILRGGCCQ
jgi:hypothetical protein